MTLKPTYTYAATIEKVIDGDTLDVDLDLGMHIHFHTRLRLEHIDAPEVSTPEGQQAKAILVAMLTPGTPVTVATQKPDKYGRALATVQLASGDDLSTWMLDHGLAKPYEGGAR